MDGTADNGGAAITGYTVTVTAPAATQPAAPAYSATIPVAASNGTVPTTATATGLTNGREYTFSVTATNSAGTSTASNQVKARPGDVVTISSVRYRQNQELRVAGYGLDDERDLHRLPRPGVRSNQGGQASDTFR